MSERIKCKYCNKNIIKRNITRHQNSKECRNKQQNIDIVLPLNEYKCMYCKMLFNRLDNKNDHEKICTSKEIYYIFQKELELKDQLLKQKDNEINIYKEENIFLKSQLQIYRPNIINANTNYHDNSTNNITINNNININFNDIQNHLDKYNIHVLSDQSSLIKFIMPIFENKMKLINECKQIISYHINDKLINDIKCKIFLSNSAGQLTEISDKICLEGKNNKLLSDSIVKNACINNKLLNEISSEEGMKNGIRKKNPMILVHEIIKYLKEKGIMEIRGV